MRSFKGHISTIICLCCLLAGIHLKAQNGEESFLTAHTLAYEGNYSSAGSILRDILVKAPKNNSAKLLLARTESWEGDYEAARKKFNEITSIDRKNRDAWISAIKNELYAKNNATALGLSNKALIYLKGDSEIERLRDQAINNIENTVYPKYIEEDIGIVKSSDSKTIEVEEDLAESTSEDKIIPKKESDRDVLNNRISLRNSFTMFDRTYEPIVGSSISFRRQTMAGSIIPRINYMNRLNKHGLQYDIDFYPKFSKRFYAYLNYGYSNASIYPNHKVGGDLYANLPGAIEFSAGMRYISFQTRDVTVITNSLGHYRGNYYFSLRSYITPQPNNLTRVSGNLLVRKYLKDAENYVGALFGMGYSPELRQLKDGDELLAETLLYIESQRLRLEYQFTGKSSDANIYRANLGVTRQELVFDSGSFFWALSAGLTCEVKF